MIVDSHQHFWDPSRGDYGWLEPGSPLYRGFQPDDLLPLLRKVEVEATILVQAAVTPAETDYLLQLARPRAWILGVVGWVDLSAADAPVQLAARAREPRFVGVRPMLQDLSDPAWILKDEVSAGLQAMQSEGLVFDALIRWRQLPTIIEWAERYETLSMVLDHAGKPPFGDRSVWRDWKTQISRLARQPNVACKLSGLLTEVPGSCEKLWVDRCVDTVLDHFGPERILWGSDWPVATLAVEYADWLHYCQEHIRQRCPTYADAVFGGNAQRIYGVACMGF